MKFKVKVIPSAKKNLVIEGSDAFKVYLTSPPVDGKANKALIDVLAEHFSVKKNQVQIVRGLTSRHKIINIEQ